MTGQAAARLGDPVAHSSAMGGFELGGLVGAAVGIAAVAFVIGTGGAGLVVVGAVAGAVAATGGGALAGMNIGQTYTNITGAIATGSTDVLVNGRRAARAIQDTAICADHDGPQKIAQGSQSVFLDKFPAARKGDLLICDGVIADGSPNVFFGAAPGTFLSISPEVPDWLVKTAAVMAIAGTAVALGAGALAAFAAGGLCGAAAFGIEAATGIGGSVLGSMAGGAIGDALGGAKGRAWGEMLGGVGGGALGAAGGASLADRTLDGHPVDVASGELITSHVDFQLGGPIPLVFERHWFSTSTIRGELGHGWHHSLDMALTPLPSRERFILRLADGRLAPFMPPQPDAPSLNTVERLQLWTDGRRFWATDYQARLYRFGPACPDGGHRLTSIADLNGNSITLHRDKAGGLEQITDSAGRVIAVRRDSAGRIIGLDGPAPQGAGHAPLVSFTYDATGDLTRTQDAAGAGFQYGYDQHLLVRERRPGGVCFHFRWDDPTRVRAARCIETWGDPVMGDARLYPRHFRYDPTSRSTVVADDAGHETRHDWDDRGLVVATIDTLGRRTITLRDPAGRLTQRIRPDGGSHGARYDPFGRLLSGIGADGATRHYAYPPVEPAARISGFPETITAADGAQIRLHHDDRGNLAVFTGPTGWQTRLLRDHRGLPLAAQDALGVVARFTWTAAGTLSSESDALGVRRSFTRDRLGRVVAVQEAGRRPCRLTRDAVGRVIELRRDGGGVIQLGYDAEGQITSHRDAMGAQTQWEFGGLPVVLRRIAATGASTHYHRDGELRLVGLTNAKGETYDIGYDALGRLVRETGFDGRTQIYEYDESGWLARQQDSGVVTRFTRDPAGRLLGRFWDDGSAEHFGYDPAGRLVLAKNAVRSVRFERDAAGDIMAEHQDSQVLRHTRDGRGRLLATALPDGRVVQYAYDAAGRFTAMAFAGRILAELRRDAAGREIARRAGGLTCWSEYDPMGRLSRQQARLAPDRSPVLGRDYAYDEADRLAELTDLHRGLQHYVHDAADALVAVTGDSPEHFVADPAGTLLLIGPDAGAGVAQGDRLLIQGDRKFEYDDRGNRVRALRGAGGLVETVYHYGLDNRLSAVRETSRLGQQTTRFGYDALGRRVWKATAHTPPAAANDDKAAAASPVRTTSFLWDCNILLAEAEAAGEQAPVDPLATVYLHEPGTARPLAQIRRDDPAAPGTPFHYQLDHVGTPQTVTNDDGAVVWQAELTAWGAVRRLDQAAVDNPFRFQGQYCDVETGLHYNRHRFYDPTTGSFVSQDPIGLEGGTNPYRYVPSPTEWIDPLGLTCFFGGAARAAEKGFPGIGTTENGGPTFAGTPYLYDAQPGEKNIVTIPLTGSRTSDFAAANTEAGLGTTAKDTPANYTWHHVDDFDPETGTSSMELVQSDAHRATTPHKGSAGQYADYYGVKYR